MDRNLYLNERSPHEPESYYETCETVMGVGTAGSGVPTGRLPMGRLPMGRLPMDAGKVESKSGGRHSQKFKVTISCVLALNVVALVAMYVMFFQSGGIWQARMLAQTGGNMGKSCLELRDIGYTESGIYTIRPSERSAQVYCDMESAGGGWTLVASIHENNILNQCGVEGRWSSGKGVNVSKAYKGFESWENSETFGTAEGSTTDEYKSSAYFKVQASDGMIWHVPNVATIEEAATDATLKYYTNSGFLRNYGGTLQSLFMKYYPLHIDEKVGGMQSLISAYNQSQSYIRSFISSFYNYTYDFSGSVQDHIDDGGNDMFDGGNQLSYQIGSRPPINVTYNKVYRSQNNDGAVHLMAATSHPFNAMMWIGNNDRSVQNFSIKVESDTGADGKGQYRTRSGSMYRSNQRLKYHAYSIYAADDPSITEVFYYISDEFSWGSVPPRTFTRLEWPSDTDVIVNAVRATGAPGSILMGYTLLSKDDGEKVTEFEIRAVLEKTMEIVGNFMRTDAAADLQNPCSKLSESHIEPVVYLKGSNESIMALVPAFVNSDVTAGFIQFRPLPPNGEPRALCPGVKTESCFPQSVCIGGINTATRYGMPCEDVADWETRYDRSLLGRSHPRTGCYGCPENSLPATEDQKSSILVFTR